jgi:hypothetical protein
VTPSGPTARPSQRRAYTHFVSHFVSIALASSVLADCGGLSTKQRLARREATQLFPHVGLGSGRPNITSIEIRGGNWADVFLQGNFKGQSASRARLGFALRDPRHHWTVSGKRKGCGIVTSLTRCGVQASRAGRRCDGRCRGAHCWIRMRPASDGVAY